MKICAIDFETANNSRASACSLAVIEYIDGEIIEHYWLIKPHCTCSEFIFTYIHGLTYEDVEFEKEFNEIYDEVRNILEGSLVLAHNNVFDVGVLRALCTLYKLPQITFISIDTVEISRKIFRNLKNHKLNTVAEHLGIELNHHNALSDAMACLQIFIFVMDYYHLDELEVIEKLGLKVINN